MNRIFSLFLCLSLGLGFTANATEGMYIPALLESVENEMRLMGLELSAEDIYSVNNSSLKDAIAQFNGGCTAELISSKGLLLTNHHCGYSQIQSHSSVENDYLKNGFWATSMKEELPNPGVTAMFVLQIEEVTAMMMEGVTEGMTEAEINSQLEENEKKVVKAYEESTGLRDIVRAYNYGNSYFRITTKTYQDVRLVGAPPSAIGKFGGDTDNWMWPRHTGDFSLFRIYADANNEPATYSEDNRPYQPERHLHVSVDGVEEGDFTMVYGFPGRTENYLTAAEVAYVIETSNPMRITFREKSLSIIDRAMEESDLIRIQYAAKQSRISNAYKKWIGQNQGLIELNALDKKHSFQEDYKTLALEEGKPLYVENLDAIERLVSEIRDYRTGREVFIEYFFYGPEILRFAYSFSDIAENYDAIEEKGELDKTMERLQGGIEQHFKDYHAPTDKALFEALSKMYFEFMPASLVPPSFTSYYTDNRSDAGRMTATLFKKSIFADKEALMKLVKNPSKKAFEKLKKDAALRLANGHYDGYLKNIRPEYNRLQSDIDLRMKTYVAGMMELFPEMNVWPDANGTLRLTYGKAEGSAPVDGMEYTFYTTADGILQKHATGNPDYAIGDRLQNLLETKKYGSYAHSDGSLRVCFTGSNHTTGGNSGSPVLDARGNLIGLNFDRSWESTMSDILFAPERCRNIMVDIRFVLWVMDVYAGQEWLIEELTLIKGKEQGFTEPMLNPDSGQ